MRTLPRHRTDADEEARDETRSDAELKGKLAPTHCLECGKPLLPIEGKKRGPVRKTCSAPCRKRYRLATNRTYYERVKDTADFKQRVAERRARNKLQREADPELMAQYHAARNADYRKQFERMCRTAPEKHQAIKEARRIKAYAYRAAQREKAESDPAFKEARLAKCRETNARSKEYRRAYDAARRAAAKEAARKTSETRKPADRSAAAHSRAGEAIDLAELVRTLPRHRADTSEEARDETQSNAELKGKLAPTHCLECGKPLLPIEGKKRGPVRKTCSEACRKARKAAQRKVIYLRNKYDPEFLQRRYEAYLRRKRKREADPELAAQFRARETAHRKKYFERLRRNAPETLKARIAARDARKRKEREGDPAAQAAFNAKARETKAKRYAADPDARERDLATVRAWRAAQRAKENADPALKQAMLAKYREKNAKSKARRYAADPDARERDLARTRAWRAAQHEKAESDPALKEAMRAKRRKQNANYTARRYAANPDAKKKDLDRVRAWRAAQREKAESDPALKEALRAKNRERQAKAAERERAYNAAKRAAKKKATGNIPIPRSKDT